MNVILKNLFNCNIIKKYKFLVLVFTLFMINIGVYADELIESKYNKFLENNQEQAQTLNTSEEFSNIENYNQMKYSWQYIDGYYYYFDETGKMLTGLQEINGRKYYFAEDGKRMTGFQKIGQETYFFSRINDNAMKYSWQYIDGYYYYFDETGKMLTGLQEINGRKYYFDERGRRITGFQKIGEEIYFFSRINDNAMKYDWQYIDGYYYYFDETGKMLTNKQNMNDFNVELGSDGKLITGIVKIKEKNYYYVNSEKQTAFQVVDGNTYFFSRVNDNAMKYSWQYIDKSIYYFNDIGVMQTGSQTINNIDYIFKDDGKLTDGWHLINNDLYYIQNGRYMTGNVWINGKTNIFTSSGIYLGIQYTPYYYMQTAGSWANVYYGSGSMKKTGCLPTSVAMALSGILGRSILPTDIASYLYYYTNEFNKITLGASGLAVQYAAKYFGVKCEGINSLSQLNDALSRGKIIVASMGTGKFAKPWYTHEIVLYNYSNGITIAYDPINSSNNGWISIYDVWNQRSFDPYDLRGGYSFYALSL